MPRAGLVLVTGWLTVLFCAGAVQAAPAGPHAPDNPTQFAYLAEQLRKSPVHVSDQIPREVPRSTAPAFAREARRLGVPTYVMVLPHASYGTAADGLLAGVHDRLGRKGLYVALSDTGLEAAQTYGVDLPGTADAVTEAVYAVPYDATPREVFRHFVDVVTSGEAHERAEEVRAAYDDGGTDEPPGLHTDTTERENQSFVTGIAVLGIPLTVLLVTVHALQRRRVRRAAAAGGPARVPGARGGPQGGGRTAGGGTTGSGRQQPGGGPGPFPRERLLPLMLGAAVLGGLVAFTASQIFDDTTSGDGTRPTAADMRARIDRVSAGLRRDPLYLDPESRSTLDGTERAHLRKRLRELDVPVVIAAVPTPPDDESGGSTELLAKQVHDRLHRDVLMVLADPATGVIELVNYSTRIDDSYLVDRPRDLAYTGPAEEQLGRHLDELLTYVDKAPRARTGGRPYDPPPAADPVEEKALPGLFTGDFEAGMVLGTFAAGLVFGLVAAARALARRLVRRGRPAGRGAGGRGAGGAAVPAAPDRPTLSWLRRTARQDLDALTAALEAAASLPEEARRRAWECLDAAALLVDGDSDGRIDADATPVGLTCAVVLARAGRTAIEEPAAARYVCHRNPLHGAARRRAPGRPAGGPARSLPVCEACRVAPGPVLRLRSPGSGGRGAYAPYPTLTGPLAALGDGTGIDQLTLDVREYFGVH
ncbi:hypothetical protein [Streptomyces sp. G7(2002)]|uniref:hypothetical protein n=1 Tax=Streptomyces sp. G7(2002) TaxID=2971798 RepID=UPI00237DFD16|nr:hypothetical protein [Streptomyces sp. G7(2002)]WDT57045.1 hypothetical protein NUT86_25015 [Streptomyces sp. G7(2002)]